MGYKRAGYTVLGCCEIDPSMMAIYKTNHHPKYAYEMDIRDFAKLEDYPEDLIGVDVLDGSPPCSVFSLAGKREAGWGVEKKFREGQKEQRLDDLFFYFLDVAERLKPKVIISENVKGMLVANAKGWLNQIIKKFDDVGYVVQLFLLNAARMGVPQKRERVFLVAHRKDLELPKLELSFDEPEIPFGVVREEHGDEGSPYLMSLLKYRKLTDRDVSDTNKRVTKKASRFTSPIIRDDEPCRTITSGGELCRMYDGKLLTNKDIINCQTFPQDFDFCGSSVQYVCGMSVPPFMMERLSREVYRQWLSKVG